VFNIAGPGDVYEGHVQNCSIGGGFSLKLCCKPSCVSTGGSCSYDSECCGNDLSPNDFHYLYCATGSPNGTGDKIHCCPAGQYWDTNSGGCAQPNDCYNPSSPIGCHTEPNLPFNLPMSSPYWKDENCVPNSDGQGNGNSACCAYDLGGKLTYSDTDIIFY
jgi:hypothetical protein